MQPQYPTQPMPQQYPAAPAYPQQFAPPAPAYPVAPAYPQQPQGYPQQYPAAPPAPPAQPLPQGTLDGYYSQPSAGGGPSFKFMDSNRQPQIGKSYTGIVSRPVTNADVRAQTNDAGQPQTYRDGRPKFVLVVPMQVQPSQEFPEGQAGWWVKGQARDELARAMAEAGAPAGPPEVGAAVRVTLVGTRPIPGKNPAFQFRVEYVRPNGAAPAVNPQPEPIPQPAPVQQQVPAQPMPPAPVQQEMPQPVQMPVQAQQQVPAAAPSGFSPDQAALFAKLTGQQAA